MTHRDAHIRLFVYGTLRPGGRYWPEVARFVERHHPAHVDGFAMWHLPEGYPAVLPTGAGDRIRGEVLWVPRGLAAAALAAFDEVEDHRPGAPDSLYDRLVVDTVGLDGHGLCQAHIYVYHPARRDYLHAHGLPVPCGDWRAFRPKTRKLEVT